MEEKINDFWSPKYVQKQICFDEFVVNDTNNDAFSKAILFCDKIETKLPVLNIYGEKYTGKSYLLQSTFQYITDQFINIKLRFFTAEEFITIDLNSLEAINVILIDDVNNVDSDNLFEKIELLHNQGKNIVFTSDLPVDLPFIETIEIKPVNTELINRLLNIELRELGVLLDDNELEKMSASFTNKKQVYDYLAETYKRG